jgi:hypothetical protein
MWQYPTLWLKLSREAWEMAKWGQPELRDFYSSSRARCDAALDQRQSAARRTIPAGTRLRATTNLRVQASQ